MKEKIQVYSFRCSKIENETNDEVFSFSMPKEMIQREDVPEVHYEYLKWQLPFAAEKVLCPR